MPGLNEQLTSVVDSVAFIVPEILLAIAILVIITTGLFGARRGWIFSSMAIAAASASMVLIASGGFEHSRYLFSDTLYRDGFANYMMILVDVAAVLTCLMSLRRNSSEYYALILTIALGCHLLLMGVNLLMIFLSLEIVSISSYVLASYAFDRRSAEGTLKYFLFGAIASAITLYGFSILYGFTGTFDVGSKHFFDALTAQTSPLLLIGGLLGLTGFLFKMAAVPMHPWAPDVYEAAPIPVIAYLSVAPKLAGLGILVKFILAMHAFGQSARDWQLIIAAISILTITAGNLSALWQKSPKRMMAYSSIAQSGFLLVGIATFLPQGIQFMLFYSAIYLLMNFAVFFFLDYFEQNGMTSMPTYAGVGANRVVAATGLTIGLIALTGLPPTAGFTAKLLIFSGLWEGYLASGKQLLLWLMIFGLVNTVISLFYYMRIPYYAFIRPSEGGTVEKRAGFENLSGLILVVFIVALFFIPGLLMGLINRINFVFQAGT